MNISVANENSLILYFADEISPEVNQRVALFLQIAQKEFGSKLLDWVPSYISLLLIFDTNHFDINSVKTRLQQLYENLGSSTIKLKSSTHHIEICYHPDIAPDLIDLSDKLGLTTEEVATIHQNNDYTIYAIGFMPNFGFWGVLDERICHPRHATPRKLVKAGSVGIAENQTGIYPKDSPGGWQIIGSQPDLVCARSPYKKELKVGDKIKINEISLQEYQQRLSARSVHKLK